MTNFGMANQSGANQADGQHTVRGDDPFDNAQSLPSGHLVNCSNGVQYSNDDLIVRDDKQSFESATFAARDGVDDHRLERGPHQEAYAKLVQLKEIVNLGPSSRSGLAWKPFVFRNRDGRAIVAPDCGLRGFIEAEKQVVERWGQRASHAHVRDYLLYVSALLEAVPHEGAAQFAQKVDRLIDSKQSNAQRYGQFITAIREFTEQCEQEVRLLDQARWVRSTRIYEMNFMAYDMQNWRRYRGIFSTGKLTGRFFSDFNEHDMRYLVGKRFGATYPLGVFPRGKLNSKALEPGAPHSPFAIVDHRRVDPLHGSDEEVRASIVKQKELGLKVAFDVCLNHTAPEAVIFGLRSPERYLHRVGVTDEPGFTRYDGYSIRCAGTWDHDLGVVHNYEDVWQLDYSNPETRREAIETVLELIERYGIDMLRVDMADQLLNRNLRRNWDGVMKYELPDVEFWKELIDVVKSHYPQVAFVGEAYEGWDELARCGFDVLYGHNNIKRDGGHTGWFETLKRTDAPEEIRKAIRRAAYLHDQVGGPDMLTYVGDHDRPKPQHSYGPWIFGATFLTLLKGGGPMLWYGGTEAAFERPCHEDGKMITFYEDVKIDFRELGSIYGMFVRNTLNKFIYMERELGETRTIPIEPKDRNESWVGYLNVPVGGDLSGPKALVIANPTPEPVRVRIHRPDLHIYNLEFTLPRCGPDGVALLMPHELGGRSRTSH